MKKLFIFSLLLSIAFASCTKENEIVVTNDNTPENIVSEDNKNKEDITAKKLVTIEVTSDNYATVEIPAIITASFDGTYRYSFEPTDKNIYIKVTSEILSTKSIAIYVGDELVTFRRGNCPGNDYELSFDLENL